MKNLEIVKSVVKKFLGSEHRLLLKKVILSIKDTTPMPHNGSRPPKKRRV